jgi:hypothetical protein
VNSSSSKQQQKQAAVVMTSSRSSWDQSAGVWINWREVRMSQGNQEQQGEAP